MVKKIFNWILNGIITVVVLAVLSIFLAKAAGFTPYVVKSGSMEPEIMTGSLCFVNTHTGYDSIKEGDVIAFRIATGDMVTHRVINITDDGFETKGDNTDNSDGISTDRTNYVGKTVLSIQELGKLIDAIATQRGMIISVTVILSLIILNIIISPGRKESYADDH